MYKVSRFHSLYTRAPTKSIFHHPQTAMNHADAEAPSSSGGGQGGDPVLPSQELISTLLQRLRDPSVATSFERGLTTADGRRAMAGLVRPRWVLRPPPPPNDGRDGGEPSASTAAAPHSQAPPPAATYNSFPARGHIDLRMEQNAAFADSQEARCRDLLSGLPPEGDRSMGQSWKKRADAIQGLIKEGLAACPGHRGLLSAEVEYKAWLERRIGIISNSSTPSNPPAGGATLPSAPALPGTRPRPSAAAARAPPHPTTTRRVDRAQAAMRDAMAERSFLAGSGPSKDEKYPLLGEDDVPGGEEDFAKSTLDEGGNSPSSYFSDRDIHRKKYKRKRRDSRRDHKSKKRKKRDRRHRSESPDSRSEESDRRSRRRRKKRKGKDRKRRKSRRSSKYDSDESSNESRGKNGSDSDDSSVDVRAKGEHLDPKDNGGDATHKDEAGKSHEAMRVFRCYMRATVFVTSVGVSLTPARSTTRLGSFLSAKWSPAADIREDARPVLSASGRCHPEFQNTESTNG